MHFHKLVLEDGSYIAYRQARYPSQVSVVCFGGFTSNMYGPKAEAMLGYCTAREIDCTVFDYLGHGSSSGSFENYSIHDWYQNCCRVIESLTEKPLVLVGTSMGGWLMLLTAISRAERIVGLIGMAPAPDFTETMVLTESERAEIENSGIALSYVKRMRGLMGLPPVTDQEILHDLDKEQSFNILQTGTLTLRKPDKRLYTIQPGLINRSKIHLLFDKQEIKINVRDVALIHSLQDDVISYQSSLQVAEKITAKNVFVHLLKSGNHLLNDKESLSIAYEYISRFARQ